MRPLRRATTSVLLTVLLLCGCVGASNERYAAEVWDRAQLVGEELDRAFKTVTADKNRLRAARQLERLSRLSHQLEAVEVSASRASKSWDFTALDHASETLTSIENDLGMTHPD